MAEQEEEPRIGVFICQCGINIGGVVNVPQVTKYAKSLPNVAYAEDNIYTCSAEGIDKIKAAIKEHKLNRVVVASCTPRTHEPLFRGACIDAGVNPYLFELANIREHCSWVHMREPEKATEKAKDIVRMSVARASFLKPQQESELPVDPSALVIGGGISGITSAQCLANQGFKVYLVETEPELGGMLRKIYKLYPTDEDASKVLEASINAVTRNKNVQILTSTKIKDVEGYIGNFEVTASRNGEESKFKVGTVIVATGATEFKPTGYYGYDEYDRLLTQVDLEKVFQSGKAAMDRYFKPQRVAMIQCVGSREEKPPRAYCSRICCMVAVKNAGIIKQWYPDSEVYIIYQDMQTYGKDYEEHNRRARETDIKFINYVKERPPEVMPLPDNRLRVSVYHALLGEKKELDCDLVVLSTPLVQHESAKELQKILKVPLGQDEFFLEAHVKLRPVDFATDGIYVCGTAHGPKDIGESVSQAYAVSSRAAAPMANRKVRTEAITAVVDTDRCVGCRMCEKLCPYGAHRIEEGKSTVVDALCKGCGVCAAACLRRAISMRHFTDDQIMAEVKTAFLMEPTSPSVALAEKERKGGI
ncbi:MAG TPA: CoB--CoM heterodisulfide reductase iron-sulfur subunit A family protein [Candidatus Bathyarchaeia archaeon]|nr:CoB--CoM heterodisulfide reductase iron-sulfur subunit A family protein [Candidatus Bathyarchaeia archaeon]